MKKDEAIKLLKQGDVKTWNAYRKEHPEYRPDLQVGNFIQADLDEANLRGANLIEANLSEVDLSETNLRWVNLTKADLSRANLRDADLTEADLSGAYLVGADLKRANLGRANLVRANLYAADLKWANLSGADFSDARFGGTTIATDLSEAKGLDSVHHMYSSSIDVASILKFKEDLPENFLRGCGLADEEIAYFRSRVGQPIRFYSCFISYSTEDEEFATRLHNDFQAAGIRCWKWDHDARTGRSLWGEIDQAIRVHDKLVLIASESSLKSPAVNREIERAIAQENERGKDVLFPVRLDDYILEGWKNHELHVDLTGKVIADARNWADPNVYAKVRDRLIRDLTSGSPGK